MSSTKFIASTSLRVAYPLLTNDRIFCMDNESEMHEAKARGAQRLVAWTIDGTLVSLPEAAQAWQLSLDDFVAAVGRGDVFEVWLKDSPYIPAVLIDLGPQQSAQICSTLEGQSAISKLVFLKRSHGGLGGRTITEALQTGNSMEDIRRLAHASVLA